MRIAILGAGNVGGALGKAWAAAGHQVTFGVREPASPKHQDLARLAGPGARAATIADAARDAEVIVVATPWPATRAALAEAGDLAGRTVIDCTNPLADDLSGLTLGHTTSAAEQVATWAPGASVFKAFNTTGAGNMRPDAGYPMKPVMFVCGDDAARKPAVLLLVDQVGFEAVDAGALTMARSFEPLALLWITLAVHQKFGPNFALALMRK